MSAARNPGTTNTPNYLLGEDLWTPGKLAMRSASSRAIVDHFAKGY